MCICKLRTVYIATLLMIFAVNSAWAFVNVNTVLPILGNQALLTFGDTQNIAQLIYRNQMYPPEFQAEFQLPKFQELQAGQNYWMVSEKVPELPGSLEEWLSDRTAKGLPVK
ncbi:hypothetical protein HZA26_00780, partial [Candidatus Nomurabacteria bacterium]|nr:hypothetical protein [Candidatus Nomurabacteria bacterium]